MFSEDDFCGVDDFVIALRTLSAKNPNEMKHVRNNCIDVAATMEK